MKTATPIVLGKMLDATAIGRLFSLMTVSLMAGSLTLTGCGPALKRPEVERQKLMELRSSADERALAGNRIILAKLLERTKAEYDKRAAAGQPAPVIDILIVSGGGDWGAFGAGFLKGWMKVPASTLVPLPDELLTLTLFSTPAGKLAAQQESS